MGRRSRELGHRGLPESLYARLIRRHLATRHRLAESAAGRRRSNLRDRLRFRTLLISLPISEDRRRALFTRLDDEAWRLSSISACYPLEPETLTAEEWDLYHRMSERLRSGQRGCFLSHRRAWQEALARSPSDLTIILEDDAVPLYRQPPPLPRLPEDLDLLYLHHQAQYLPTWPELLAQFARIPLDIFGKPFRLHSIDAVLASHCGKLRRASMPASGYAVTRSGARKLLAIFEEVGNHFQWDSIMLRHAVSDRVFARMSPYICANDGSTFYHGQRPENASRHVSSIALNAYAIHPPLVLHDHETPSVKFSVAEGEPGR